MAKAIFVAVLLGVVLNHVARADERAETRAILEQVIKAHGGEATLRKFVAMHFKMKGTFYEGGTRDPFAADWFYQGFDAMKTITSVGEAQPATVEVIHGNEGWAKEGREATETLNAERLKPRQEYAYASWVTTIVPLKNPEFRLFLLDEISVSGRKAVGLLVDCEGHDPVKLYFDKQSFLLVQCDHRVHNAEEHTSYSERSVYSDYRSLQGVQAAYAMTVYWDGAKVADLVVVEGDLHEKPFDDKVFAKP